MKAIRAIFNDHTILMYSNGTLFGAAVAGAMSFSTGLLHLDMEFDEFIKEWVERLNECDDFERIKTIANRETKRTKSAKFLPWNTHIIRAKINREPSTLRIRFAPL